MATDLDTILVGKKGIEKFDWSTFLITILITAAGLISIYSATHIYAAQYESGLSPSFLKQVVSAGLGLGIMVAIMFLPLRWLKMNSMIFYAVSIGMLILVLFIGDEVSGTKGWLNLGFITIQPSEIAKIATIMMLAFHLSRKGVDVRNIRDLFITVGIVILPVVLIAMQPDIGSATVFLALLMGVLLWAGFDNFILYVLASLPVILIMSLLGDSYLIISIVALSAIALIFRRRIAVTTAGIIIFLTVGFGSPVLINSLEPHQKARIETFLNPNTDPRGKGYNVIQSKLAVGSGGLTGKGYLQGTQTQLRYIPKQWTDFIFSVPTEEFGFVGGVSVILLLAALMLRSVKIGFESDEAYSGLVAAGIASVWFYHTLINVGMAVGIMPVMGIPLPFMSAGGTFLLVNMVMVGLLLNFYRTKRLKR